MGLARCMWYLLLRTTIPRSLTATRETYGEYRYFRW